MPPPIISKPSPQTVVASRSALYKINEEIRKKSDFGYS